MSDKISAILISQSPPTQGISPYQEMGERCGVRVHFCPFIRTKAISEEDFKSHLQNHNMGTGLIFTSKNAVIHFFHLLKRIGSRLPENMKYFCASEQTYLQLKKHVSPPKEKIFSANGKATDLLPILEKHRNEQFLFPCSHTRREDIPSFLKSMGSKYRELKLYETLYEDLSTLRIEEYDLICFFSPSGVSAFWSSFPNVDPKSLSWAVLGPTTGRALEERGCILSVESPRPHVSSMVRALETRIRQLNRS
ncbi:MAG: uroporphyrinogen-III synthase [Cytophagales bacterium]|nr:uroporphyrinogen-III synthase [Cytophagales bacterium]